MEFKAGMIVRSRAGHDKDTFFLIIQLCGEKAYIADGKRRKLDRLKCKNLKHLAPTNEIVPDIESLTDRGIREILWKYNYGEEYLRREILGG